MPGAAGDLAVRKCERSVRQHTDTVLKGRAVWQRFSRTCRGGQRRDEPSGDCKTSGVHGVLCASTVWCQYM